MPYISNFEDYERFSNQNASSENNTKDTASSANNTNALLEKENIKDTASNAINTNTLLEKENTKDTSSDIVNTSKNMLNELKITYNKYVNTMPYDVPKRFSFSIFLTVVIAFTVCNIVLSIFSVEAIGRCSNKNVPIVIFITLFLIFSWLGNIMPYYGNLAALISMVITSVLVIVSSMTC